jgi:SAM-dependent methyltransferase
MKVTVRPKTLDSHGLVQEQFDAIARVISQCGTTSLGSCSFLSHYQHAVLDGVPETVSRSALACGNPLEIAFVQPGERVLDLGCGAGMDCLLAARAAECAGHVIGVDMTAAMLELARRNLAHLSSCSIAFCQAHIEELPIADACVDVVISNSSINLSPTKQDVFREIFRVLRPGGRFVICDMVLLGTLAEEMKRRVFAWAGCVNGTLTEDDYLDQLRAAGFSDVNVESRTSYGLDRPDTLDEASREFLCTGIDWPALPASTGLFSVRITGNRPLGS